MRRILSVFLLVGCGGAEVPPATGAEAKPEKVGLPKEVPTAQAPEPAAPIDPAKLPPYARSDANLDVEYPNRARLQRGGRFYVEWPAPKEDDLEEEKRVDWEPPVIEDTSAGRPVRILCRDADAQLAVFAPLSRLGTIAREPVVLSPKATPPESAGAKDPGARIAKGAVLTVVGTLNSVDHVRFESVGLSAEGFARHVQLASTYRPNANQRDAGPSKYDAELASSDAVLLPEPSKTAKPIAKLSPYTEGEGAHRFQLLGSKKAGFTLVRLLHPETEVVGWIEDGALKLQRGEVSWEKEHKFGAGKLHGSKMIPVKRGAILITPGDQSPVGVMLSDHETPCIRRCDSERPLVAVRACGGVARAELSR